MNHTYLRLTRDSDGFHIIGSEILLFISPVDCLFVVVVYRPTGYLGLFSGCLKVLLFTSVSLFCLLQPAGDTVDLFFLMDISPSSYLHGVDIENTHRLVLSVSEMEIPFYVQLEHL